jgi:hypothetical protein
VRHSAGARAIAGATGAFVNDDPLSLQSWRVVVSIHPGGAIGRLVPEDVIGLIRYLREDAASATTA